MPVNTTTVALCMLLIVLAVATRWGLKESIFTSILAVLAFNYFFLPPYYTFTIADPQNWVALFAFLVTAITTSQLSAIAKRRAQDAIGRRNELAQLYELSRAMLMDGPQDAVRLSVTRAGQVFNLAHIAFYDAAVNEIYGSAAIPSADLEAVAHTGDPLVRANGKVIPVSLGTRVIGSLGLQGVALSGMTEESIASLLAINYERVRALDRAGAAEIARRNEEFRSSLLDGLAHDLKTPLTAVRTCVTRLISIPPRSEEVRQELLSIIDQESERLQQSINELVQLARIESPEPHLSRELTNAADLVYTALEQLREENRERYKIDIPPDLVFHADSDLLPRALRQILENARKYAPADSEITIQASEVEGQATVAISDRGPGIRRDELTKIFEKFYRGHAGSAVAGGTGMGLAIAKSIVEAHGGTIHAVNRPGGGATISFTLGKD